MFDRFPRLVRDLARDLGKQIRFDVEGEEIELDRSILDEIGDPLLHLLRNAADHGIESPEQRVAAGKPAEGRILLSASRERNTVALRVSDDGRGHRPAARSSRRRGAKAWSTRTRTIADRRRPAPAARAAGFSTAEAVTDVSGRGVGVDVVMTRVRALGGTLEVRSEPGQGTTFTHPGAAHARDRARAAGEAGGERYAVPLAYVAETVEFDPPRGDVGARPRGAGGARPGDPDGAPARRWCAASRGQRPRARPTVILEIGDRRAALVVDALIGQQEIVVEPFDAPRGMPPFVGGATILGDGAPALILDAAALV